MFKTKNLIDQINQIIDFYGHTDDCGDTGLYFNRVPQSEMDELYAIAMSEDYMLASEANGPDNLKFDSDMLPALIKVMSAPNKESIQDFVDAWKEGIRHYMKKSMSSLIEDEISRRNQNFPFREKYPYAELPF